ncbi:hypothetical protein DAEQUDRAFT_672856 [Daedalea quercina L-15889]|uniref:Uncharacterized protein n=1 Tax=Daedalea quercina L-15889 TaxID=1314783 RepID=A0A165P1H9_9APHY|nr:hypothetical protein DAEQUDRAFT_672856 [Daedalea quercina L-15889]
MYNRCTRWYLPLVLLPFPIASPYFLWLFIFSTTLHARPCFYCIILLSALFMSSCYWQPVPLESSLAVPWSDNITTYGDALASLLPDLPDDIKPTNIPVLDRCWCDFSGAGFFDQFNVTEWERRSVLRLKDSLEVELKAREAEKPVKTEPAPEPQAESTRVEEASESSEGPSESAPGGSTVRVTGVARSKISGLWNKVSAWPFPRKSDASARDTASTPAGRFRWSRTDDYTPRVRRLTETIVSTHTQTVRPSPTSLLRKEYDLRPYGFAVVLDFGWEKSDS